MGRKPTPKHSIDRINVNGNYEPNNCRWATIIEQNNNKRNQVKVEYNGQSKTIREWSDISGIMYDILYDRYKDNLHKKGRFLNPIKKYNIK